MTTFPKTRNILMYFFAVLLLSGLEHLLMRRMSPRAVPMRHAVGVLTVCGAAWPLALDDECGPKELFTLMLAGFGVAGATMVGLESLDYEMRRERALEYGNLHQVSHNGQAERQRFATL